MTNFTGLIRSLHKTPEGSCTGVDIPPPIPIVPDGVYAGNGFAKPVRTLVSQNNPSGQRAALKSRRISGARGPFPLALKDPKGISTLH